ncbi:MAG: hypothetical protein M3R48_08470 [Candidatus Dormibacteraeota bacterium]|nr:hypothetical protein [Candidatus Dormibacteraeota bacterium]
MPALRLRFSEHEAAKPYARPFMVTFVGDDEVTLGSVALNGSDLLYQRQFLVAVAALSGELFHFERVEHDADPQRAWLDHIASLLPARAVTTISPRSTFDADSGRLFGFVVECGGGGRAVVDAATLYEYQDFQAAVAHQTGGLVRVPEVEAFDDVRPRQRAWGAWLRRSVERPSPADAMAASWPWS